MNASQALEILSRVKFLNYRFHVETEADGRMWLQASFDAPCNVTGVMFEQKTRKWLLSEFMTPSELVQTAFKCALTSVEHETREQFTYRDQAIFKPHYDVEDLVALCATGHEDIRIEP